MFTWVRPALMALTAHFQVLTVEMELLAALATLKSMEQHS